MAGEQESPADSIPEKAMILAAGMGTRLRPLTEFRPKALVPVANKPVIAWNIDYLKRYGVRKIVVNAHHFADQISEYLAGGAPFGAEIEVRVERKILGTGGGIKNTEDFWDERPFLVVNSDIMTSADLDEAYRLHCEKGNSATLILHDCPRFNQIKVDEELRITDIGERVASGRLAFTGIHIIGPDVLDCIPEGIFSSITDCYRKMIKSGRPIGAFVCDEPYWRDIGTIESYVRVNREALQDEPFKIDETCRIHGSTTIEDWAVIGKECVLEEDVEIRRSIIWENVRIAKGIKVEDSIVRSGKRVFRDLRGEVL